MRSLNTILLASGILLLLFPVFGANAEVHTIVLKEPPVPKPWRFPASLQVIVVDQRDQPVADAKVSFHLYGRYQDPDTDGMNVQKEAVTDQDGRTEFSLDPEWNGKKFSNSFVRVHGGGAFFPARQDVIFLTEPDAPEVSVHDEVTVTLREGTMHRLRVVDSEGNGIPGVEVQLWPFRDETVYRTDDDGYWIYGPVENNYNFRNFHAIFKHPEYVTYECATQAATGTFLQPEEPHKVTLQRGNELFGTVTDEDGTPIAGAIMIFCGNRHYYKYEMQTDENGKYHIKSLSPSDQLLIIRKPGMVRHVSLVYSQEFGKQHDFTLKTAKTLRVQLDPGNDDRIYNFTIEPLPLVFGKFQYDYQLPMTLTEDGVREWDEAPDEEIEYRLSLNSGRMGNSGGKIYQAEQTIWRLRPQEEPHVIKVTEVERDQNRVWRTPEKLQVTMIDENGKPKQDAKVCLRIERSWDTFEETYPADESGNVEFDFSRINFGTVGNVLVTVSAEGCRGESRQWRSDPSLARRLTDIISSPEHMEFLLHPTDKTAGVVRDDEGKPLEGVKVQLTSMSRCYFQGTFIESTRDFATIPKSEITTFTDENGIWIFDIVPSSQFTGNSTLGSATLTLEKEGFVTKKDVSILQSARGVEHSRFTTMNQAKLVSGTVVDSEGNPLEGVVISFPAQYPNVQIVENRGIVTDQNGKFAVNVGTLVNGNKVTMLLSKKDWTQSEKELDLTQDTDNLSFVLDFKMPLRFVLDAGMEFPKITASIVVQMRKKGQRGNYWQLVRVQAYHILSANEGKLILVDVPEFEMEYQFLFPQTNIVTEKDSYVLMPGDEEYVIQLRENSNPPPFEYNQDTGGINFGMGFEHGYINYGN